MPDMCFKMPPTSNVACQSDAGPSLANDSLPKSDEQTDSHMFTQLEASKMVEQQGLKAKKLASSPITVERFSDKHKHG